VQLTNGKDANDDPRNSGIYLTVTGGSQHLFDLNACVHNFKKILTLMFTFRPFFEMQQMFSPEPERKKGLY
jgi:hypothetical protein